MLAVVGYRCTECGREGELPGEFAGKKGRCPGCHSWLVVSKGCCRSSASGAIRADDLDGVDPDLGPHLLELERVPLRMIDTLACVLALGLVTSLLGLILGSGVATWAGTVSLAAGALLWFAIEAHSGHETLTLAEGGLRLPNGEVLAWAEVLTFERGHTEATRWTIHSLHGDRRVAGGFCLVRGGHWIQLLWPPLRERARETLHRRAARAMRVHAA